MRSNEKMGKPRSKMVKPILKKLSQSEKNSLDLDRGWDEQNEQFQNQGLWGASSSFLYESQSSAIRSGGSSKDVSFAIGSPDPAASSGRRYNHSRSISGTSHVSVATSGSGSGVVGGVATSRAGATFVHPFQQMPRTATPPLSYATSNSLASDTRDYSPVITEDDDDYDPLHPTASHHSLNNHNLTGGKSNIQRPSIISQRTSSYSDSSKGGPLPSLRINTRATSTTPAQSSRLAHVSSRSDLKLNGARESSSANVHASTHYYASPSNSVAPMSPFSRSSFDSNFRLRAKSDLDTATRAEHLREARRKFEMKEQAKEEKYAREEIRRREKADNKRVLELEKQAAAMRKEREAEKRRQDAAALAEAMPRDSKHVRKISGGATSSGQPSTARRVHPAMSLSERFTSSNYDSMETRSPPSFGNEAGSAPNVTFEKVKRTNTAKRKTHGAWTMFILWLRTRLLRMNSKDH
ncbi:uncharacterized protein BCR38DRAFT_354042 [Pseudomassariella vexata]|uniref:Uncharacterized protein n=1 Tax=Pseudomassariella vexata TaxID=1141098 RepID=A0A1Y2DEP2_9PEZI|nr:uncharacterized protein BCR38DRAFT_354042 [Pseudomassariella vexata]ORY57738.1 hypothetical protein BCR38DRAFT_354042 [Pseudomassariella vexata]